MSSGSSIVPQLPMSVNLGITYGAYLIGAIVAAILYGILVSQTIFYFNQYSKDPLRFKILVAALFILDTLTVIFETHGLYHYLIATFGNFEILLIQVWSVQVEALLAYTIMLMTQGFFVLRIWEFTGRKFLLPSVIVFFSLAAFGSALTIVVKVFTFKFWSSSLLPYMKILVATNKSLETCADALITFALCFYLHRGRSQFERTNTMINKLIVLAVNRGAITTILQLFYLIAFEIKPDSMAWVAFHVSISKVYSNSVLATLNSRNSIRGVGEDQEIISFRVENETLKFSSRQMQSNELTFIHSSAQLSEDVTGTLSSRGKSYNLSPSVPVEIAFQKTELVESA